MSTYKREIERTEQLGLDYQKALNGIITEIKKDDSLSPTKMLDIVGCIQSIKGTRKRWASGGSLPYEYKYFTDNNPDSYKNKSIHYNSVNFGNIIPFVPTIIVVKSNKGLSLHLNLLGKYVAIVPSHQNIPSNSIADYNAWYMDHAYYYTNYRQDNLRYLKDMKFNHNDVMIIWANEYTIGSVNDELRKLQIESWIAIE